MMISHMNLWPSHQTSDHSSFRALWCPPTRSTSKPCQRSLSSFTQRYGPNNQIFLLLNHLMKKGTFAYWLPFNQRHPSFPWIGIQALLNWNAWLHDFFGSSTIVVLLTETKSKQSKVVHVSQSKDLWQLKTIRFWFHRKTISRHFQQGTTLLKVVCCLFIPSWTRLVFSEFVVESKIVSCRTPIYILWSFMESILWQSSS